MADFTWVEDRGATAQHNLDISEVSYSDGYEHRMAKSINPEKVKYNLAFKNRPVAIIDAIVAFLRLKGGVDSFTFKPSDCGDSLPEVNVVCKEWNTLVPVNGVTSLTCVFREVPI